MENAIVQLNKYPKDKYNVLVPVTTMQVASNLQRITVSEVQLDVRQDSSNRGPSKDIYYEKSSSAFAITKVGGMKLAAAANISIVDTATERTEGCQRCIEMARATGKPRVCGTCEHVHDVAVTVTIRVPEPSGGFRLMKATKEIDCTLEAAGMKDGANGQQFRRFLPHRTAMAESKAFMRAIRAALGLAGTYAYEELKKPFIVARVVPNLDAPEIKQAVASNYLQSMGMLFEMPTQASRASLPAAQAAETVTPYRTMTAIAPQIAAAEAKLEEITASIQAAEQTAQDAKERTVEIDAERAALGLAVIEYQAAKKSIEDDEPIAGHLADCQAAGATADALEPQLERLRLEIAELTRKVTTAHQEAEDIRQRAPKAPGDVKGLRAALESRRKSLTEFATQRGVIKAKLEAISEAEAQTAKLRRDIEDAAATLNDYTVLTQAFGLDGIQYMIIRGVVPEIMRQSNDILAAMTGGRMAVDIRTEREQKSTKTVVNSLEVWINTITGGNRPYQSHSGGEKVKIALAVTLGLADVKARRAGVQLGMLFIDEPPFLDADGTEAYADALVNMAARNPNMRILAISHDPTMKARFSQNIIVTGGEDGSSVTME